MIKEALFNVDEYFRGCHAATLCAIAHGNTAAAWFAGTHESHSDVAIWLSRRIDSRWETPKKIFKVNDEPHWNPVLFAPGNGSIYLYFKTGMTIPAWITWVAVSNDDGVTWSKAVELVPGDSSGGRGPVKNKPIVLSNGDWLAPASVETQTYWKAFADISTDEGKTWKKSNLIHYASNALEGLGVIQPTVWESQPGQVHMLLRSTCGKICRSDSNDFGRTWTPAYPIDLPNNCSGIDLAQLEDGRLVLIYNPTSERAKRTPLSVSISSDNGISWRKITDVEVDQVEVGHLHRQDGGEFSYPSIITDGQHISAVYTRHRKCICFWRMSKESIARSETLLSQNDSSKLVCN